MSIVPVIGQENGEDVLTGFGQGFQIDEEDRRIAEREEMGV
jgi:hypothetical protein